MDEPQAGLHRGDGGWEPWCDVGEETLLATRSPDGLLEYQRPLALIRHQHQGTMLHFAGRWHDLLVTPKHRLLAKKTHRSGMWEGNGYEPVFAADAFRRCQTKSGSVGMTSEVCWNCSPLPDFELPRVDYVKGEDHNRVEPIPIEPWLEFLGLFLGDGSATIRPKVNQYITQIRCMDADKRKHIMDLCAEMGFNSFENGGAVRITHKQLTMYLAETFGKTEDKRVPRQILDAPPEQLAYLWSGLMASDGHISKNGQEVITQKNRALIDDLQEVALKLGKGAWISKVEGSPYNPDGVYWLLRTCRTAFRQYQEVEEVDYDGMVYCATVPNDTLLVRRNGKPCWSCNCNQGKQGDPIVQPGAYDGGLVPDDVIAELYDYVPVNVIEATDCQVSQALAGGLNAIARLIGSRVRLEPLASEVGLNQVDAAIAKPLNEDDVDSTILEVGQPGILEEAQLGMAVKKSGRTTGLTSGVITQVDMTVTVQYPPTGVAIFTEQLASDLHCEGGDSGSLVLGEDNATLALLFAGGTGLSIFNQASLVAAMLDVEFG